MWQVMNTIEKWVLYEENFFNGSPNYETPQVQSRVRLIMTSLINDQ